MPHTFPTAHHGSTLRRIALATAISAALAGCGDKEPTTTPAATGDAAISADEVNVAAPEPVPTLPPSDTRWTPEVLENLLAPVALYPDVILAQVLVASTNPQEVLDAGNWLLENDSLEGEALDEAAQQAGFTPPIRALLQFPLVVDMMCQDLDWTADLGQAYVDDQSGVLDAAQRLRVQARDVGNLASSEQIEVATVTQDNQQVVTISPPDTEVVYVPQYDPVAVYAAQPAAATTTTVVEDEGYSTGELVTTGLLAFGAGMLINEIFDDDDDDYYYGGGYWGRPPPYYPPYPYRPRYGDGFYPAHDYNRGNGNFNNNTVIVNRDNDYWKNRRNGIDNSPITEARRNRPELTDLNARAAKGPARIAPRDKALTGQRDSNERARPKIQGSYAGARAGANNDRARLAAAQSVGVDVQRDKPKIQGSYAGAKSKAKRPAATVADRGHALSGEKLRQKPRASQSGRQLRSSAFSGSNRGSHERAASLRGRQSMQQRGSSRSHAKPQRKFRR